MPPRYSTPGSGILVGTSRTPTGWVEDVHIENRGPAGAPPVLLLHGGGVAGWMWRSLGERLSQDHRVIVPDLPGHGRSSDEPYLSHAATANALAAVLEEVGTPVSVIGFSLGGQLAVLLAATRPDLVERVMVISAQAEPFARPGLTLALIGATARLGRWRWFAKLQAKEFFVPEELLEEYLETSKYLSKQVLVASVGENIRFVPPPEWPRFAGPAVVLVGQRENRLVSGSARVLHEALPGSELEVVEGCGHGIPFQRPEWLEKRARVWLTAEDPA